MVCDALRFLHEVAGRRKPCAFYEVEGVPESSVIPRGFYMNLKAAEVDGAPGSSVTP